MLRMLLTVLTWAAVACAQAPSIKATLADPNFSRVLACGHRGAPLHAPENTIPSLQHAVAMGADIIEIDVRYTRDGRWVVFHDSTVMRLTGKTGSIEQRTLDEVRELRINLPQFPNHRDLRILTLEERSSSCKTAPSLTWTTRPARPSCWRAKCCGWAPPTAPTSWPVRRSGRASCARLAPTSTSWAPSTTTSRNP